MTHRSTSRLRAALLGALCLATAFAARAGSPPVITGVTAAQQPYPSKLVDIAYTLSDPDSTAVNVSIFVSKDSGASWTVPALSFQGRGAPGNNLAVTATPTAKTVVWDAGADWNGHFTSACRVRVVASDNGLVGIPAGTVTMGDQSGDGIANAPVTAVTVSAFQMDSHLVTGSLWNFVKEGYADTHGYAFDQVGSFKAPSHPVHAINWYDAVKWCNARSEMEGKTPVYYTDYSPDAVYRTGRVDVTNDLVAWWANGYRLPTEAEWEKAARGGVAGHRFPWSDSNHISESRANYISQASSYDDSNTGYNTTYATGGYPFTSPVGSFAPNGYGLYDMAGNVFEWCGDWYPSGAPWYAGGSDPQGPVTGSSRVFRGGSWNNIAGYARCADRSFYAPTGADFGIGFRVVLSPGQP